MPRFRRQPQPRRIDKRGRNANNALLFNLTQLVSGPIMQLAVTRNNLVALSALRQCHNPAWFFGVQNILSWDWVRKEWNMEGQLLTRVAPPAWPQATRPMTVKQTYRANHGLLNGSQLTRDEALRHIFRANDNWFVLSNTPECMQFLDTPEGHAALNQANRIYFLLVETEPLRAGVNALEPINTINGLAFGVDGLVPAGPGRPRADGTVAAAPIVSQSTNRRVRPREWRPASIIRKAYEKGIRPYAYIAFGWRQVDAIGRVTPGFMPWTDREVLDRKADFEEAMAMFRRIEHTGTIRYYGEPQGGLSGLVNGSLARGWWLDADRAMNEIDRCVQDCHHHSSGLLPVVLNGGANPALLNAAEAAVASNLGDIGDELKKLKRLEKSSRRLLQTVRHHQEVIGNALLGVSAAAAISQASSGTMVTLMRSWSNWSSGLNYFAHQRGERMGRLYDGIQECMDRALAGARLLRKIADWEAEISSYSTMLDAATDAQEVADRTQKEVLHWDLRMYNGQIAPDTNPTRYQPRDLGYGRGRRAAGRLDYYKESWPAGPAVEWELDGGERENDGS